MRALDDAEMTWRDIDAVVIGTAPDIFEGVMMPELYLADALGAAGKPIMRVHTAGSVGGSTAVVATHLVAVGRARARAHRRVREAVRGRHDLGALGRPQRRRRRRRLLRPAHPRLHRALGRARVRRLDGRGEGPQERAEEPVRPPPDPRHHARDGARLADGVGADPPARVVPDVRRRLRDGAHQRGRRRRGVEAAGVGARHRGAQRARPVPRPRPGEPAGRPGLRGRRLHAGRHHRTRASDFDVVECYVPFSWYEPMWMENLGFAADGRGLEADRERRDRDRRRPAR